MPRTYDRSRRAADAARTTERLVDVAEGLIVSGPMRELTLNAVAEGAGVTVQTLLRHLGSRQGCIDAVRDRILARVDGQRGQTAPGDVDGALDALLVHYEADGRLMLGLQAQSTEDDVARAAVEQGRAYHRAWVLRCFGPRLRPDDPTQVDALVAATDLLLWKLLRLDLARDAASVRAVFLRLVHAVLEAQ